jgi:hypothetical protein
MLFVACILALPDLMLLLGQLFVGMLMSPLLGP